MSYSITIGQRTKIFEENEWREYVPEVRHENAPADGVPTDYTNSRWPSYIGWSEFVRATKLNDVMNELMKSHPGIASITISHKKAIDEAAKLQLPTVHRVRINWLQYWVNWALENCEDPVLCNS